MKRASAGHRFPFELFLTASPTHDKIRKGAHRYAKKACKPLIKNGRYFAAPQKSDENFKRLFARLAAAGAGRPVDKQGFADGPWTPETLADEISSIEANEKGIETRTVQVWFQDNYNGISDTNIHWLARVFGCGDPEATSEWQAELRAAKDRLAKERREQRKKSCETHGSAKAQSPYRRQILQETEPIHVSAEAVTGEVDVEPTWQSPIRDDPLSGFSIARRTEAMFSSESSLTLPLVVFTCACAMALIAFTLNIHSVLYTPDVGPSRQVGFLWAPNWTIVFVAILPLFLTILVEHLNCWLEEWRPRLLSLVPPGRTVRSWDRGLTKASYSFWVTFFVTVIIASAYNWTATHFIPLLQGDPRSWPMDWGRIAIVQPDKISIPSAIVFSALVFTYNGFTAYLFFTGHIFMHLMKSDFALIMKSIEVDYRRAVSTEIEHIGHRLMTGIFRCTALGLAITIMMKLQSSFLQSGAVDILEWLWGDIRLIFGEGTNVETGSAAQSIAPGFLYSFLCVVAIAGTFASAQLKIRMELSRITRIKYTGLWTPWTSMNICMTMLVVSYFAIGFLPGFTVLLLLSLLVTLYAFSRPEERETIAIA